MDYPTELAHNIAQEVTPVGSPIFSKMDPQQLIQALVQLFQPKSQFAQGGAPGDPGGSDLRQQMMGAYQAQRAGERANY